MTSIVAYEGDAANRVVLNIGGTLAGKHTQNIELQKRL